MTRAELVEIVSNIRFRDWDFLVLEKGDGFLLQIQFWAPDSTKLGDPMYSSNLFLQKCRKWYLSSHSCVNEVVRTAWKAVEAALLHEAQEEFLYRGQAILNSHLDPNDLAEALALGQVGHNTR